MAAGCPSDEFTGWVRMIAILPLLEEPLEDEPELEPELELELELDDDELPQAVTKTRAAKLPTTVATIRESQILIPCSNQ